MNGRLPTSEADQIIAGLEQQLERGEWTEDVLYGAYAVRAIADPRITLEPGAITGAKTEETRNRARAVADRAAALHEDVRSIAVNDYYPLLSWSSEQRSTAAPSMSDGQASAPGAKSAANRTSVGSTTPGRSSRGRSA